VRQLLANWTGALALAVGSVVADATRSCGGTDAAGLLTCSYYPGITVGGLAEVLGLTGSGAVRLADRLEGAGLLRRLDRQGRSVMLELTRDGQRLAEDLQDHRLRAIEGLLSPLTTEEQGQLAGLLDKVLHDAKFSAKRARRICRYCDHGNCDGEACPIGRRLREWGEVAPRAEAGKRSGWT
jgi:DNA-binding MarR family transcriptional regulator